MTESGWQDMSTAPRDGTVLTLLMAREARNACWDEDLGAWYFGENRCHVADDVPGGWRPLGGTP